MAAALITTLRSHLQSQCKTARQLHVALVALEQAELRLAGLEHELDDMRTLADRNCQLTREVAQLREFYGRRAAA